MTVEKLIASVVYTRPMSRVEAARVAIGLQDSIALCPMIRDVDGVLASIGRLSDCIREAGNSIAEGQAYMMACLALGSMGRA